MQCTCAIVATNQAGKKSDDTKCVTVFQNLGLNSLHVFIFKEQTRALLSHLHHFATWLAWLTVHSYIGMGDQWIAREQLIKRACEGSCTLQGIEYALKRLSKGYIVQVRCWEFSFEISNTFIEKCCQKPSCWSQMSQSKLQGQCWKASLCRARHSFDARAFRIRQLILLQGIVGEDDMRSDKCMMVFLELIIQWYSTDFEWCFNAMNFRHALKLNNLKTWGWIATSSRVPNLMHVLDFDSPGSSEFSLIPCARSLGEAFTAPTRTANTPEAHVAS